MENKRQLPSYSFFQASEDAKKLVNQERSFACAEIESARAVVQRIGEALDEQERDNLTSGKKQVRGRHLISFPFYFIFKICAVRNPYPYPCHLNTVAVTNFFFMLLGN